MVNQGVKPNWTGDIYVDKIAFGNEDPFVFINPWVYSYCHASQLRRNVRNDSFIQTGSKLIFVSGQQADKGILCVDTVFLVGGIQRWGSNPLQLPLKYQAHFRNNQSDLWRRHFRFPFHGSHNTVSHTYEAELWNKNKHNYSFLPLDENGDRVSVPFVNFNSAIINKIAGKVKGKYPVLLTENEINLVLMQIEKAAVTKVLKIKPGNTIISTQKGNC